MRIAFNHLPMAALLLVLIGYTHPMSAQQTYAYVNLINAIGTGERTQLKVNGITLSDKGYRRGDSTGPMALPPGPIRLSAKCPGFKSVDITLTAKPNETTYVVLYKIQSQDKETGKLVDEISFTEFDIPPMTTKGYTYHLLYASEKPAVTIQVNGKDRSLEAGKLLRISNGSRELSISKGEHSLGTHELDSEGDFLILVFDSPQGSAECILLYL